MSPQFLPAGRPSGSWRGIEEPVGPVSAEAGPTPAMRIRVLPPIGDATHTRVEHQPRLFVACAPAGVVAVGAPAGAVESHRRLWTRFCVGREDHRHIFFGPSGYFPTTWNLGAARD